MAELGKLWTVQYGYEGYSASQDTIHVIFSRDDGGVSSGRAVNKFRWRIKARAQRGAVPSSLQQAGGKCAAVHT